MPHYICKTCGIQYAESATPLEKCLICEDERQYILPEGQQWTTLEALQKEYSTVFTPVQDGLTHIKMSPAFAIGQQCYLIPSEGGNILWETVSLIDDETIQKIKDLGGIQAIAISHPHFYDSMVEWSYAFGKVPIYLHAYNKEWVMRPDPVVQFWDGETLALTSDITLIKCGGHFPGSSVLHWQVNDGALFTGDTIYVVQDRRYVTFMYSYPNMIPLSAPEVHRIVDAVEPFAFDRIYSNWEGRQILQDAKAAVRRSAERYIKHIQGVG